MINGMIEFGDGAVQRSRCAVSMILRPISDGRLLTLMIRWSFLPVGARTKLTSEEKRDLVCVPSAPCTVTGAHFCDRGRTTGRVAPGAALVVFDG